MSNKKEPSLGDCIREIKLEKPSKMEYTVFLNTGKDRKRLIKRVERIVRSSMEYGDEMQYLKKYANFDKCAFFNNLGGKIEIHHEPFTLYEIVDVVISKFIKEGQELNDLLIADEVLELHYANMVGLVPLCITIHQMRHNQEEDKIRIPLQCIYGEYEKFLEKYDEYIEDDDLYNKLMAAYEMSEKLTAEDLDAITKEFTYLSIDSVPEVDKVAVETSNVA